MKQPLLLHWLEVYFLHIMSIKETKQPNESTFRLWKIISSIVEICGLFNQKKINRRKLCFCIINNLNGNLQIKFSIFLLHQLY